MMNNNNDKIINNNDSEEDYVWKEDLFTIDKKPKQENSQSINWKNKWTHISANKNELNELIYAGLKLVWEKISVALKNMNRNSKPGWEIQLEMLRNLQQQAKMIRQR